MVFIGSNCTGSSVAVTERAERVRLPITPATLGQLRGYWIEGGARAPDHIMLWASATLCYHGFFRAGEITVPTVQGFDQATHLAWGDVAADNQTHPLTLKVRLKKSKTDQLGAGVDVFVGRTDGL